jgi:hypothetical protein
LDPEALYVLEIRSVGVGVRARWNEVAVYANPSGAGRIAQTKLDPYVVEGENEAVLVFRAAAIPPEHREKAGQPSLRVRVIRGRMGEEAQSVLVTVSEIFALKNEEMARALGLTEADALAAMEQFFAAFWGQPVRRMEPLDDARIELAVQAGGRLVAVVDREGGPALRGAAGNVHIAVPVMVTRGKRQWLAAR